MGSFKLVNTVEITTPYANVDALYEQASKVVACFNIPLALRRKGLTVGILEGDSIVEYWWKSGTADIDLIPKLTITQVADYTTTTHIVLPSSPETILRVFTIPADTFTNETWLNLAVSVINDVISGVNKVGMGLYFNDDISLSTASKIGDFYNGSLMFSQPSGLDYAKQNQFEINNINLLIKDNNLLCTNYGNIYSGFGTVVGYINRPIDLAVNNYIIITGLPIPVLNNPLLITIESIILNKTN